MAAASEEDRETIRPDRLEGWPAPEERGEWYGDPAAELALFDAYRSGRMHHAWLIGGPKGIGKATLAYRFARFILANSDPAAPPVRDASDLAVPEDHRVFRMVASRTHPNLLVLERPWSEKNSRFLTELAVDEIRRTVPFFGSTGAGWRIAVVDSADEMSISAANALLKVLEEPPARSLFLLVCHAPGRLLPTIRSRSRRLDLQPLGPEAIGAAMQDRAGPDEGGSPDLGLAADLSEGSLRRAILLVEEDGVDTYREFIRLTARLPEMDVPAMHAFADKVSRRGADDAYEGFADLLRGWLGRRVRGEPEPGGESLPLTGVPLARWAEVWEKLEQSSAEADELNLDRKQVVLTILMTLARAARM